jgi:hypothetical protein
MKNVKQLGFPIQVFFAVILCLSLALPANYLMPNFF